MKRKRVYEDGSEFDVGNEKKKKKIYDQNENFLVEYYSDVSKIFGPISICIHKKKICLLSLTNDSNSIEKRFKDAFQNTFIFNPLSRKGKEFFEMLESSTDDIEKYKNALEILYKNCSIEFFGLTEFQKSVLEKTKNEILVGDTKSYQFIAKSIEKPKSYRAVANALGKNPLPIIIPCHRVCRKNGDVGGFGGGKEGTERKKEFIDFEKRLKYDV